MGSDADFDEFYATTRRRLVLQTFALTGDLPASTAGVRDAYIAAWHHWGKVSGRPDPTAWVRPLAWQHAVRRHNARLRHRDKDLDPQHGQILDAVAALPARQRRALVLTNLADVSMEQMAREVGLPQPAAENALQTAIASFAVALDTDSTSVRGLLESLSDATESAPLPRASIVRRSGRKRRRTHTVGLTAAAVVATLVAGVVVNQPGGVQATTDGRIVTDDPPGTTPTSTSTPSPSVTPTPEFTVTGSQLLDADQVSRLGGNRWHVLDTFDNTEGEGLNTICQRQRFADPEGSSALVRTFATRGRHRRSAVQTVEVSTGEQQAARAFDTTVGWYAGCKVARLQLIDTFQVEGIGDQALMLTLRGWERPVTTYTIAIARTGQVITSTVGTARGVKAAPARQVAQSLADAVVMLCGVTGGGECAGRPRVSPVPPPLSGEVVGMLAVVDLPPVGGIAEPWVGTEPTAGGANAAATTCDHVDFGASGARQPQSRTFLIPGANLPERFGLSETMGTFGSSSRAASFVDKVRGRMTGCEKRDLASTVRLLKSAGSARSSRQSAVWQLSTEVSRKETVHFWMAVTRVGNRVAQVNFAPARGENMTTPAFRALIARASDRLTELSDGGSAAG